MNLVGKITTGLGDCSQWLEKYAAAYTDITGIDYFPGTLNVELPEDFDMPADSDRLESSQYEGEVSVSILPCRIFDRAASILRTDANQNGTGTHPRTIIEIATDVELRDEYYLQDGDEVTITID